MEFEIRGIKMPYINKYGRSEIVNNKIYPTSVGDLNFKISEICHKYIMNKGLCYATLNEVIGVLECAKQELYRQVAASYEDKKKKENGSVSELDEEKE
jgi:hypothetical protein